ncbi:hypothetical protein GCM10022232_90350 [Streptomyces plumbiresistens]|uniref:Transposase n=1 Tax=Streptomyces plumbiresistens TaxID=511811 RepID=A0ABP7TTQ7_9ACTN
MASQFWETSACVARQPFGQNHTAVSPAAGDRHPRPAAERPTRDARGPAPVRHHDLAKDKLYGHIKPKKNQTDQTGFLEFCRCLRSLHSPEIRNAGHARAAHARLPSSTAP